MGPSRRRYGPGRERPRRFRPSADERAPRRRRRRCMALPGTDDGGGVHALRRIGGRELRALCGRRILLGSRPSAAGGCQCPPGLRRRPSRRGLPGERGGTLWRGSRDGRTSCARLVRPLPRVRISSALLRAWVGSSTTFGLEPGPGRSVRPRCSGRCSTPSPQSGRAASTSAGRTSEMPGATAPSCATTPRTLSSPFTSSPSGSPTPSRKRSPAPVIPSRASKN